MGVRMGFVLGFLPWILYWALVGNVPFRWVTLLVLVVALAVQALGRLRRRPTRSLEVGSLVVFVLLAIAAFVFDDAWLEKWLQPLSNLGILLVALVGLLVGRPFVREYAAASVDERTARSDGFATITRSMTWLWVGVFAAMTVVSALPPIVDGSSTLLDEGDTLSVLCYWVLPFVLLGVGGLVSGMFPPWFEKQSALVDARQADEAPAVVAQPAAPPDQETPGLAVEVPAVSRHDDPFVPVVHAPAGSRVRLTATAADLFGRRWASDAEVDVPASGSVTAGTTDDTLTDMRFAQPDTTPDLFVPPPDPWQVTVTASVDGLGTTRRTVARSAGPGLRAVAVDVDGRPGLLVTPAGSGHPGVVCFGGSEGGFESQVAHAHLLAAHGFAALAACWVPEADAVAGIASIPLERFTAAVRLLAGRPEVDPGRLTAMGVSRGAEGLLAAIAAEPDTPVRGLVLVSPSSLSWQAIGGGGEIPDTPSWTSNGQDVPWRPVPSGELMGQLVHNAWTVGRDRTAHRPSLLRLRPAYEAGLAHGTDGALPAERVACPLLLVSGTDDQVWPATEMSGEILARRARPDDEHVAHPGAGHLIRLGALPTDAQWTAGLALGGGRTAQAAAQRDTSARVTDFLRRATAAPARTRS
ncbi:MAG: hypothetical protein J0I34_05925 [Pseudonocardia sp.]|uniref:acyl-CoA thioester hydrolase/BAAT C-terminal domain-containing protein n=1 Tax=unclassified Pseudonocardia TaxID=2619320 RepID=UPI000A9738C4|nr:MULTISPECIES: acyl-CoA thioester hydrolase/BAAT C-terminal domain-containing protein [unclassified Pseudonocardia]MBN9108301.1 hypothetical protein [Pseudonocardia sp.]